MRLGRRVRLKDGEGAFELALRLAARHGFSDFRAFWKQWGVQLTMKSFASDVSRIVELSGLPYDQLRDWTLFPTQSRGFELRGERLFDGLLPSYRRFCPVCWDEDIRNAPADEPLASVVFIRAWWRTTLMYACPVHHCAMIDRCVGCGSTISLDALPLDRCDCEFHHRTAQAIELPPENLVANSYVAGRLSLAAPLICPTLDRIPLFEVGNVLRRLGVAALFGRREGVRNSVGKPDKDIAYDQSPVSLGKLLSAGFEYARDGSQSLIKLLEKMIERDQRQFSGPTQMFGQTFRTWAVHEDNPIRKTIDEVWHDFVALHSPPKRWKRASRLHGPRIAHLAARPQLLHPLEQKRFETALGRSFPAGMSRKLALQLGKESGLLLTKADAAGPWRWEAFTSIASTGLIPSAWYCDMAHADPFFANDLREFSYKILSQAAPICEGNKTVSFFAILRKFPKSAPFQVANILTGAMPLFRSDDQTRDRLFILGSTDLQDNTASVSRQSFAFVLGLDVSIVDQLIAKGIIAGLPHGDDLRVSLDEAWDFSHNHLTAARLAVICSTGMESATLEGWLIDLGVSPVSPGADSAIFPRADAIRAFYENWTADLEPPVPA